jgi:hypothetical protein
MHDGAEYRSLVEVMQTGFAGYVQCLLEFVKGEAAVDLSVLLIANLSSWGSTVL